MTGSTLLLGIDWGRGNFKITGSHGTIWLPSHVSHSNSTDLRKGEAGVRVAQPQHTIAFANGSGPVRYHVGHNAALVGTPIEALDISDYTGAYDQRALLYAALTEYFQRFNLSSTPATPYTAKVSVGVPQKALVGEDAPQRKSAIRQWLTRLHTWTTKNKDYALNVEKVGVASQAVGALYYYMTRPDKTYRSEIMDALLARPLGILSIGSSTLELTAVQLRDNGRSRLPEILPDFEGSYSIGAYHMLNMSDQMAEWSLGYRDQQFRTAPKHHEASINDWLRRVQGIINQRWGSQHKDFSGVFIVGGMLKVPQVRDWVKRQFKNSALAGYDLGEHEDDAITAISQGLYRQIPA